MEKTILDVTCGDRTIWFQKNEPHTIYCDKRREEWEGDFGKALRADGKQKHRHLVIDPDIQCDFTDLPFEDESFQLVVFDPPHIENLGENSWMRKSYGSLDGDWRPMIHDGFAECMRVLKNGGGACVQVVGHLGQYQRDYQRDRSRASVRSSVWSKDEHALDVLHEV
jgi:ubiquinone/menaquinone biosynthesis C-methylase UbiE